MCVRACACVLNRLLTKRGHTVVSATEDTHQLKNGVSVPRGVGDGLSMINQSIVINYTTRHRTISYLFLSNLKRSIYHSFVPPATRRPMQYQWSPLHMHACSHTIASCVCRNRGRFMWCVCARHPAEKVLHFHILRHRAGSPWLAGESVISHIEKCQRATCALVDAIRERQGTVWAHLVVR